jgi:N-acetylglucosaminyl-diphospho-decaprenol L-rhamnosyltransferase
VTGHVAITIVGYRNIDDVGRCIAALSKSTYHDFEIVICENGGTVACRALRDKLPARLPGGQRLSVIEAAENGGYAAGINICIGASSAADAWWLLNPDTEAEPQALAALVNRLERGYHAVGGTVYFSNGRVQSHGGVWRSWLARAVSLGNGDTLEASPDVEIIERKLMYLSGASMLVGRDFLQLVGPMPEDFFLYCEEVDWCLHALSYGAKLGFSNNARVLHHQGTTTGHSQGLKTRSKLSVYLDERNKMLITKRHFPVRLLVAAPAALVLMGMRYLRKGALRQFGYGIAGWYAGLQGESGPPHFSDGFARPD